MIYPIQRFFGAALAVCLVPVAGQCESVSCERQPPQRSKGASTASAARSILLLQRSTAWRSLGWRGSNSSHSAWDGCSRTPCSARAGGHLNSSGAERPSLKIFKRWESVPPERTVRKRRTTLVQSLQEVFQSENASQPIGEPLSEQDVDQMDVDYSSEEDQKRWSKLLPLELHLAGVTLAKVLDDYADEKSSGELLGPSGVRSLASLLLLFRQELAQACKVHRKKILMNAIFGRFLRASSSSILKSTSGIYPIDAGRASLVSTVVPFNERLGEEVVVRFFVQPRGDGDDFESLVNSLQDQLSDSNSTLMKGNLSALLKHASLTTGYQDVSGFTTIPMEKLSNLALPFAISALFTGILIWLAG
ncbi:unnamed protein product [Durusdinium trenchii]|uniref:Transmembrane protein n=1 Tax=Durusdinium trenchii TaxID=1381693 RepID=A0ABP0KEM8_9DINO